MAVFPLILGAWSFLAFLFASMSDAGQLEGTGTIVAKIVNVILGFGGIVSLLMIPVGLVVGIIVLMKKDEVVAVPPSDTPEVKL